MKKVLSALFCVFLVSCGANTPNLEDGQKVLQKRYESEDCLKIISFNKTNGLKRESEGVSAYQMEYEAIVELKEGCTGIHNEKQKKFFGSPNKKNATSANPLTGQGYVLTRAGDKVTIKGVIDFVKKENGWQGSIFIF
jgi:hypothetical protein